MLEWAEYLGAFVRWLVKGCRTILREEVEGIYEAKWGPSYDIENLIIGVFTAMILIALAFLAVFVL